MKAQIVIGLLFVFLGAWILLAVPDWVGLLTGGVVALLGIDALVASWRGRDGLLSKIGPMP